METPHYHGPNPLNTPTQGCLHCTKPQTSPRSLKLLQTILLLQNIKLPHKLSKQPLHICPNTYYLKLLPYLFPPKVYNPTNNKLTQLPPSFRRSTTILKQRQPALSRKCIHQARIRAVRIKNSSLIRGAGHRYAGDRGRWRNKCTLVPFYPSSCYFVGGASATRRDATRGSRVGARGEWPSPRDEPTTRHANAPHKPPATGSFLWERGPAEIHEETDPRVRRPFVTWTPEKS